MTSFLGRLRGNANNPGSSAASVPIKKDVNVTVLSPLERLLSNPGPLRQDGSDKFFGLENFGSTCYANSIIQCLYYSTSFRDQVISFPPRPSVDLDNRPQSGSSQNGLTPIRSRTIGGGNAAQRPKPLIATPAVQLTKTDENKDSPEYKKKQALIAGPVISLDYENANNHGMTESLFTALKDIFEAVIAHNSRTGVVSPHKFLEILRRENEMFRTPMHQDAHEFLNLLLNNVVETVEQFTKKDNEEVCRPGGSKKAVAQHQSVVSTNPTRWVHELFEGTLTSETRCLTCENVSQRDEPFLDLSVDLEQHTSVTACLRKFSAEEMLCERNKFHCDNCSGLQEAEKRMKVKRLPRILALHLKRFKYTEDYNRLQKLFHRVVYPYYLRLFNTTDDAEDPDRLYELYAVVVHIGGGPYHGHYVSIIKTKEKGWLLFDDEMVEPVDKSYVNNFFGGEGNLACAYVLFYQETTVEAMQRELEAEGAIASDISSKTAELQRDSDIFANGQKLNGVVQTSPLLRTDTTVPFGSDASARVPVPSLDRAYTEPAARAAAPAPHDLPTLPPKPNHESSPHMLGVLPKTRAQPQNGMRMESARDSRDSRLDPAQPYQDDRREPRDVKRETRKEEKEAKREEKAREKEQKAREKDLEKMRRKEAEEMDKRRRRETDERRKDGYRQQEEELRAAMAASRVSKVEEDEKRATSSTLSSSTEPSVSEPYENDHQPVNGGPVGGGGMLGLARFRSQTFTMKSKQKDKREKQSQRYMFGMVDPNAHPVATVNHDAARASLQSRESEDTNGAGASSRPSTMPSESERGQTPQVRQSVPTMPAAVSQQLREDPSDPATWTALPTPPKRSMTENLGQTKEREKEKGFRFGLGRKKSMMYGS